jgi:hypothetical protein
MPKLGTYGVLMKRQFCPCAHCTNKDIPVYQSPCNKCSVEDWNEFKHASEPTVFRVETFSFKQMKIGKQ